MAVLPNSRRMFSCDVAIMQFVDDKGNTINLLGIYTDCRLHIECEQMNAFAPHDTMDDTIMGFITNHHKNKKWSLEMGTYLEIVDLPVALIVAAGTKGNTSSEIERGLVLAKIARPGTLLVGPSRYYSGYGYITAAKLGLQEGNAITQTGTITGRGKLTIHP